MCDGVTCLERLIERVHLLLEARHHLVHGAPGLLLLLQLLLHASRAVLEQAAAALGLGEQPARLPVRILFDGHERGDEAREAPEAQQVEQAALQSVARVLGPDLGAHNEAVDGVAEVTDHCHMEDDEDGADLEGGEEQREAGEGGKRAAQHGRRGRQPLQESHERESQARLTAIRRHAARCSAA